MPCPNVCYLVESILTGLTECVCPSSLSTTAPSTTLKPCYRRYCNYDTRNNCACINGPRPDYDDKVSRDIGFIILGSFFFTIFLCVVLRVFDKVRKNRLYNRQVNRIPFPAIESTYPLDSLTQEWHYTFSTNNESLRPNPDTNQPDPIQPVDPVISPPAYTEQNYEIPPPPYHQIEGYGSKIETSVEEHRDSLPTYEQVTPQFVQLQLSYADENNDPVFGRQIIRT